MFTKRKGERKKPGVYDPPKAGARNAKDSTKSRAFRRGFENRQLSVSESELPITSYAAAAWGAVPKKNMDAHHGEAYEDIQIRLYTEQQAHEETRSRLERALSLEQQAHATTRRTLTEDKSRIQRRLCEARTVLAGEQHAHEETRRGLATEQRAHEEIQSTLAGEQQAHEETRRGLAAEQRAHEETRTRLSEEQLRNAEHADWILARNEIEMSRPSIIGQGGWGRVEEGRFRGSLVAVKQIYEDVSLSLYNRRLFEREMNIASKCRHPCLLQFIGATNDNGNPLFVTEMLDTSLRAVLEERALEPDEITNIALDVARALNYLHLHRPHPIIHRDISSVNVLLWKRGESWRGKVSDYGAANFMQDYMTQCPGAVVYAAPEARTSRQSPKLDVYSYGVLLCEMNIRDFPDPDRRQQQVAEVADQSLQDLIRRCLNENPEDRPSMEEIILEFERR